MKERNEGVQRTETNMLTRGIVRELLLNSINHKAYATGVPIQVSIYDDKMVIFNMGSWSKRVPTDERIYEKHESVPHNPKLADVSFRCGDVESWGRGFIKIKSECSNINAPLPIIDAENDGVSITATGCEKYMSLLRYGQYGQVGVDGVRREKEKNGDKKTTPETTLETTPETTSETTPETTSKTIQKILDAIRKNPKLTIKEIAELVDVTPDGVKYHIRNMRKQGVIKRVGPNKGGSWSIIDKRS